MRQLGSDFTTAQNAQAQPVHIRKEIGVIGFKAPDGADGVFDQRELSKGFRRPVLDEVFGGGFDAVATGFAGDVEAVGIAQAGEQGGVELRAGVGRVRHFGLQGAEVFGQRVFALADFGDGGVARQFPAIERLVQVGMDVVAPAADLAMDGPQGVSAPAGGFQRVQIGLHVRVQ